MREHSVKKYVEEIESRGARLVAISKTKPNSMIQEVYDQGQRDFGENKVQELVEKHDTLPKDIHWHMVGHLQRNKVKYIAPFVSLIHAVDTIKLLKEINKEALKNERTISILLQVHIATESTKFGFTSEEIVSLLKDSLLSELNNISIDGLMGMATNTDNKDQVASEFHSLKQLFDQLKPHNTKSNVNLKELSMGMSGDYKIALENGSTLIRIGSAIFGARNYG